MPHWSLASPCFQQHHNTTIDDLPGGSTIVHCLLGSKGRTCRRFVASMHRSAKLSGSLRCVSTHLSHALNTAPQPPPFMKLHICSCHSSMGTQPVLYIVPPENSGSFVVTPIISDCLLGLMHVVDQTSSGSIISQVIL
jgi:hypothetical protein